MLKKIGETIRQHRMLVPGQHVLVAVSGGADSVALAYALHHLESRFRLRLTIAHLNHGIRGGAADADAHFVRELAWRLGLPCVVEKTDVPRLAREQSISLEMAAREARYRFLVRTAQAHHCSVLATAHTADDQVETILLKLARGTGPQGLSGIPYVAEREGVVIIRPLREVTHREAVHFLRRHGLAWREDASNKDLDFLRNRVRHEVLPLLESRLNPGIRGALLRTAAILREENAWFDSIARDLLQCCVDDAHFHVLKADMLGREPLAARRRIVRLWLMANGVDPEIVDFTALDRIEGLIRDLRGTREAPLGGGWTIVARYKTLTLERGARTQAAPFRQLLAVPGETLVAERGLRITVQRERGRAGGGEQARVGHYPADVWLGAGAVGRSALVLRSWRPGDRIRPLGLGGSKKLQDIFTDEKVPRHQRSAVPVLECRGEVVWVAGYRVARGWEVQGARGPSLRVRVERV